jgi:phage terminase large subunit-like protein
MSDRWDIKAKREYQAWLLEKENIQRSIPIAAETESQKIFRVKELLSDFVAFAKYYCGHLASSEFGYFHKKDTRYVIDHPDCFALMEYPREHAKSIIYDVILPLFLKARGELTGMMVASASEKKASTLLGDIQAELMFNKRFIHDFGEQYSLGNWQDGYFVTADGVGFWAFGRGQSPRGTRKSDKRPNYGVIDDVDDAVIVRNTERVKEVVDWILGDFYGAMPNKGSRLLVVGNRIHKQSILAHIAGDIEPDDPKRQGLYHSKVYAVENPRTRKKDLSPKGVPAWKENFTREQLETKMKRQGWRIGLREFFHEHVVEGGVFKEINLPWVKCLQLSQYDKICTYNDPSYKKSEHSDCKGIVMVGRSGRYFDIIDCFMQQCSTPEMVKAHYTIASFIPTKVNCTHWMEANFIQDLMLEEYWRFGEQNEGFLYIKGDKRAKPDKEVRIENLTALTDMGYIRFNIDMKGNPHMIELRNQFLGFPNYQHDDGPDAVEGAIFKLNTKIGKNNGHRQPVQQGNYRHSHERSAW